MDAFHLANSHFVDEDYESAILSYTRSLEAQPAHAQSLLNRGATYLKLKKYEDAVKDFDDSLRHNPSCDLALYRKGVALFELERFAEAKAAFEQSLAHRQQRTSGNRDTSAITRYIRKCDAEASEAKMATSSSAPSSSSSSIAAPTQTQTQAQAQAQPVYSVAIPIKYQYYQSLSAMNISVLAKNLSAEDVLVSFAPTHLRVVVKYTITHAPSSVQRKEEVVFDKPLFAEIDVEKSRFSLSKTKLELVLAKSVAENWPSIEAQGQTKRAPPSSSSSSSSSAAAASVIAPPPPVADPERKIPKPYASSRDWDRLGSEISKELEAEKPEGEEALQKLFQQIYRDADPETKMAMKKSFQTSGGTVLSTNWKEVGNTDYEKQRQAPKGMEWRNWEGEKLPQVEDKDK